jgi:hypothetical protein
MKSRIIYLFSAILFSVIISLVTTDYSICQEKTLPSFSELDGHKFLNNTSIGLPFTNTYYKTVLGMGQTVGLDLPDLVINNKKVYSPQGNLVFTDLVFVYQQQIRDWLAFNGKIIVNAKVGTEAGGLITEGINLGTAFNLSWMANVYQNKKMSLSSSLYIARNDILVVDLYNFVKNIIDSSGLTKDNKLVRSIPLTRGGLRLNYAYAFNKTFGAIANATVDYGESAYRTEGDAWNYSYALGFDADLYPIQKVPLGFLAGFMHNSVPSTREETDSQPNVFLFSINYTGRKDLDLGLEVSYNWYKPSGYKNFDGTFNILTIGLNSTIYFW